MIRSFVLLAVLSSVSYSQNSVSGIKPIQVMPFQSFTPSSIDQAGGGVLLMDGVLDWSVALKVRILPGGIEVRTSYFSDPFCEWRPATFSEIQELRVALRRYVSLETDSADRELYQLASRALDAAAPSRAELMAMQDQIEAYLVRPFVPHQGLRVYSVEVGRGNVIVNVENQDQIAQARALVEKRFPQYAGHVVYRVGRRPE